MADLDDAEQAIMLLFRSMSPHDALMVASRLMREAALLFVRNGPAKDSDPTSPDGAPEVDDPKRNYDTCSQVVEGLTESRRCRNRAGTDGLCKVHRLSRLGTTIDPVDNKTNVRKSAIRLETPDDRSARITSHAELQAKRYAKTTQSSCNVFAGRGRRCGRPSDASGMCTYHRMQEAGLLLSTRAPAVASPYKSPPPPNRDKVGVLYDIIRKGNGNE